MDEPRSGPIEALQRLTGTAVLLRSAACGRQVWRLVQVKKARACILTEGWILPGQWCWMPRAATAENRDDAICRGCMDRLLEAHGCGDPLSAAQYRHLQ